MTARVPLPSRRTALYLLVTFQLVVFGGIVAVQELNRALDPGPGVDLEIPHATASKDPFRGAAVGGQLSLDTTGVDVAIPSGLAAGDEVLVFFASEVGAPPRIVQVQRRGWGADPLFGPGLFSVPGRVTGPGRRQPWPSTRRATISIGSPAVSVALDLPDTIPVADAALDFLTNPAPVRVTLRRGALSRRFLTDLRVTGQSFPPQMSVAFDAQRDRLAILAAKSERADRPPFREQPARSSLFLFDGSGREVALNDIPGHFLEGIYAPPDERFLALFSPERYPAGPVQLVHIGEGGTMLRRSPQIHSDRILGLDPETGETWALIGTLLASPQPPFVLQRFGLDGFDGPRIGPLASRPRLVLATAQDLWIVEPDRHLVSRYDRSGTLRREYPNLNTPAEIALDGDDLLVVEANRTQLTCFAADGTARWRSPRFQGLAWILPEPGMRGGWVAAARYENANAGLFRYDADGRIARVPVSITPRPAADRARGRLASDVIGDLGHGRFFVRESRGVAIVGSDGQLIRRIEEFRFAAPLPLPQ